MKLRTQLLVGVGALLLVMVIVIYLLPTFLVRKDVYEAAEEIHTLLIEDHRQLIRSQKVWLENTLSRTEQSINSLLLMIYERSDFSKSLLFSQNNPLPNVWNSVARIASYDPEIGFVQAHSIKAHQTVVITPYPKELYLATTLSKEGQMPLIHLEGQKEPYLGIPIPNEERGHTFYALINLHKAEVRQTVVEQELKHILPDLVEVKESPSFFWAVKIELIRLLAPMILEGFALEQSEKKFIPEIKDGDKRILLI